MLIAENVGILALFQALIGTILVFLTPLVTEKYVIDHKHVSDRNTEHIYTASREK